MATSKKRIEWIDLAKGICIFLVVFRHVSVALDIDYPLQTQFASFRMPLYFILSGLFFKQYEGFAGFLKRKTNKLLIPFLFFLITTSVIPFAVINHESSLKLFFTDMNGPVYNFAIWFLLCLFEINILFYLIQLTAARLVPEHQTAAVLVLCLLLGCCGLALGVAQVMNLFYLCTMLTGASRRSTTRTIRSRSSAAPCSRPSANRPTGAISSRELRSSSGPTAQSYTIP